MQNPLRVVDEPRNPEKVLGADWMKVSTPFNSTPISNIWFGNKFSSNSVKKVAPSSTVSPCLATKCWTQEHESSEGMHSWESLRSSEKSLNSSQYSTTEKNLWSYLDWNSVNFYRISEILTDSNLEYPRVKRKAVPTNKNLGYVEDEDEYGF